MVVWEHRTLSRYSRSGEFDLVRQTALGSDSVVGTFGFVGNAHPSLVGDSLKIEGLVERHGDVSVGFSLHGVEDSLKDKVAAEHKASVSCKLAPPPGEVTTYI